MWRKIINRLLRPSLFLLVLLLPTLVNLVEHAGSGILLILTVAGIAAWFTREHSTEFSRAEKWLMLSFSGYFFVCLVFFFGHVFIGKTIPVKWQLDNEVRMLAFIPIYYLFLRAGLKEDAFWFGIALGAIASGVHAVYYTYVLHGVRAAGSYHAIAFGDIALMLGFMSLTGIDWFRKKHPVLIALPVFSIIGGLVATFLSATRGAILAVPVLILILLVQVGKHPKALTMRVAFLLILSALISGSFLLPGSIMDARIHQGFQEVEAYFRPSDARQDPRLRMWAESIKIIRENPLTGVGNGGYKPIIQKRAETDPNLIDIKDYGSPHNMFLANMVDYGAPGLVILLAIFFVPLWILIPAIRGQESLRQFGFAGLVLIFAFVHFALTESIFHRNIYVCTYLILMAATLSFRRQFEVSGHETTEYNHDVARCHN